MYRSENMTINNFDRFFPYNIKFNGEKYYKQHRLINPFFKDGVYYSSVQGSSDNTYDLTVKIDSNGQIDSLSCTCPYGKSDPCCKHTYALMLHISKVFDEEISFKSSSNVSTLISAYTKKSIEQSLEKARIEPELFWKKDDLYFSLKIGIDRMYVVKDIDDLVFDFNYGRTKKYGKNFEFTHSYNLIDERSLLLLKLASDIYAVNRYSYGSNRKDFHLSEAFLERFLDIYSDQETLVIDGDVYDIVRENPKVKIKLSEASNNRLKLTSSCSFLCLGLVNKGYFVSKTRKKIYIADLNFTNAYCPINSIFLENSQLFISEKDVPSFYNSVIKSLEKQPSITIEAQKLDIIPPQLTVQLYIDTDAENNDTIYAALKYLYGEKIYDFNYDKSKNSFCDIAGETTAEKLVSKYFQRNSNDRHHPFIIEDENAVFDLITSGLPELSKFMELFVSERFKRLNVRKPVQPGVGVSVSGGMLEMNISASGYTKEELVQVLASYRRGSKFHRFKDGTFALIDDGIKEIDSLAKELNINDKAFLKEHITVPMYRMLYLNSLQKDHELLKLERDSAFKKMIKAYKSDISDEESDLIPDSLNPVMRDYQKYGFNWLNTLGKYHMGGILADDMGLGKTLQTISLMLYIKQSREEKSQFLVICPSSLTINWQNEILKFAPELSSVCMTGTVAERSREFEKINDYDVIITSYAMILRDIDKYENLHFAVQILDEAQNIKNHNTQSAKAVKIINSDLRFALTGTPIENTLAELWSIFDFIMPGYLHNYNYFKKTYETPIVKKGDVAAVQSLQRLSSPFILRRLKKDVLKELPDKTETVLETEFGEEQKKIYTANAAQVLGELKEIDEQTDKLKILAMLTRLRQICCDPSLVYENYNSGSAKLEQCMDLVKSCIDSGHKILLFSQFTSMLDIISKRFDDEAIAYYTLTGKTKPSERIRLVNEFNENDVNVFLISLKAGGTGLNLTGADIVIHYDPWWNLSAENQASDRAYRIGQKKNVQVYKLIAKDTIEEKIRILQERKSALLDTATGGDGDILNMSASEVMELLK